MRKTTTRAGLALLACGLAGVLVAAVPAAAQPAEGELQIEGPPTPSVGGLATAAAQRAAKGQAVGVSAPSAGAAEVRVAGPYKRSRVLTSRGRRVAKVDKSFEGFGFDDNFTENGVRFIPPDPIGAAGRNRIVAVVNSMIEVRTKGGALKWREGLRDFFGPLAPEARPFDPKIVYDDYADRFVVVALELIVGTASQSPSNISRILLAVSKDAKPDSAGDWHFLAVDGKTLVLPAFGGFDGWADYPGFEVDEEAVYVTANIFTFVPFGFFGGERLWIVDKGRGSGGFYDGGPGAVTKHDAYAAVGLPGFATTTMPAQVHGYGGVGGPGSTLGTFLVSYSGLTFGGPAAPEAVQVITVDDPIGKVGGPFFTHEFVVIGDIEDVGGIFGFPALPDAPQLGTTTPIEVNDRRALDAVWRDDKLWMTTTINPNAGADAGETTAHWMCLDTQSGPGFVVLDHEGDIGGNDIAPGAYTYFPSVAVNRRGHAAFGFSASAPTIFAGAFVAGRREDDPAGTVRPSLTVKEGEGPYKRFFSGPRNRWGDYSGISVDPNNEDFFWVFNEFADTPGSPGTGSQGPEDGRWGTAWGRFKL